MNHNASRKFWECYEKLPAEVQALADKNFELLKAEQSHPSLHLKSVGEYRSVRVGLRYRALGIETSGDILWFWIGTHAAYDKILS